MSTLFTSSVTESGYENIELQQMWNGRKLSKTEAKITHRLFWCFSVLLVHRELLARSHSVQQLVLHRWRRCRRQGGWGRRRVAQVTLGGTNNHGQGLVLDPLTIKTKKEECLCSVVIPW